MPLKIVINNYTILILVIFIIGYIAIFISEVTQPVNDKAAMSYEFEEKVGLIRRQIAEKEQEISTLKLRVGQYDIEKGRRLLSL